MLKSAASLVLIIAGYYFVFTFLNKKFVFNIVH